MKNLVIAGKNNLTAEQKQELAQIANLVEHNDNVEDKRQVAERLSTADVALINAFTPLDDNVLRDCPNLRHVVSQSAGINHVDLDALSARNISVNWYQGYCARSLAEKAMAFILMTAHDVLPAIDDVRRGNWNYLGFRGREVGGKTLGILGLGESGVLLKKYAESFSMKVIGVNSQSSRLDLEELFRESDIISINLALNEQTFGMLDQSLFALARNNLILVNLARGKLIDEADLIEFLNNNPSARAMLDVICNEPVERNDPIWSHSQITLTPHIGWNSFEAEAFLQESIFNDLKSAIKK